MDPIDNVSVVALHGNIFCMAQLAEQESNPDFLTNMGNLAFLHEQLANIPAPVAKEPKD
jgi:hypothetical protein